MRHTKRILVALALVLAAVLLAPLSARADEAVSLGGADVAADDTVYYGYYNGDYSLAIPWVVDAAGSGELDLYSRYILWYARIHPHAPVSENPNLTLETSWLYTSDSSEALPGFRSSSFTAAELGALGAVTLCGDRGPATTPDGSEDWYWIDADLTKREWEGRDRWLGWWGSIVGPDGDVNEDYVISRRGVRPASSLSLASVLFTSAAEGGKSGAAGAGGFVELSPTGGVNEWKVTLLDGSRDGFAASAESTTAEVGYASWTVPVTWSGAGTGQGEYVSAILLDEGGAPIWYGTVAVGAASGTQDMTMPAGLGEGLYTLCVFSEQRRGDQLTDYASAFEEIALEVTAEPEPVEHKLTIEYVYADGSEASPRHTEQLVEGAAYSVESPKVAGFVASQEVVEGTMGAEDVDVTVTYEPEPEPEPDVSYACTSGDGSSWTKGSDAALSFTFERSIDDNEALDHLTAAAVDGVALTADDCDVASGSVVLSLRASYLEGLSAGEHTLVLTFDDGEASATFTVKDAAPKPKPVPKTADVLASAEALCALVGGMGMLGVGVSLRRRRR